MAKVLRLPQGRGFLFVVLLTLNLIALTISTGSVQAEPMVRLSGHTPTAEVLSHPLGAIEPGRRIPMSIVLPPRNEGELTELLSRLYDPKDPLYGKFLTPSQFEERFGPSDADYAAVQTYFESKGFTITHAHGSHGIISVDAPASTVESALGINLKYYSPQGKVFFAPDREPQVPESIASHVVSIIGLDNAAVAHPHSYMLPLDLGNPDIGTGVGGTMAPSDIKKAYNLNGLSQTGTGQTLALFELDGYTASDITAYENQYSLTHVPLQNVLIDGVSGNPSGGGGQAEVTLDIELQAAVAPGATKIKVFEGPNSAQGLIDTYAAIATDDTAMSISSSWGAAEANFNSAVHNAESTIFQQMAAQGQTIFAAAGDSGAYDDGATLSVDDPASQPYMCGVGGTTLSIDGSSNYTSESTWGSGNAGGGGGISSIWSKPSFQSGFGLSSSMRNVPDVSLDANPNTGYSVYVGGGWNAYGGTSCAAPLWSAFAALVDQARVANGATTLGQINPYLYTIGGNAGLYASDFHDIHDGSTNLYYAATLGYDNATGLGSFNGANLLNSLVPPAAPASPSATAGDTQVALTWTASANALTYNVKKSTTNGSGYSTIASPSTNSYTDSSVVNGTTYYYVITAVNPGGESANSVQVSGTPVASNSAPSTPSGVTATAGDTTVSLSWGSSGGATSYNVKRSTTNGSGYSTVTSPTGTSCTDTGLTDGTTYYYVVSAVNTNGESANSSQVSATPQVGPPSAPTGVSATAGSAQIVLSWTASSGATSYNVKRSTTNGSGYGTVANPSSTTYTNTSLSNGTTYYYVITALDAGGESSNSSQVSATPQVPAPSAPTNLSATGANASVGLTWTASSGAATYNVKRSTTNGSGYGTISSPSATSYTDSGVSNGTTYYYVVTAVNAGGESSNSSQVSATPNVAPPSAPTSPSATAGNAQVSLTWTGSLGATSYHVKRSTTTGSGYSTVGSPTSASYTDTGLTNGTTYYYVITAVNTGGESSATSEVSATPALPVPATPTGVNAVAGNAQVSITWTASTYAASYTVKRSTTSGGTYSTVGSPTGTIYTDSPVTNGTTYYYEVSATDVSGTSSLSAPVSATPNVPIPNAPTGLGLTTGDTIVNLSWNASTGAASYNVKKATTSGGPYSTIANPSTTTYADHAVSNGTTYYYEVSALNAGGESSNSSAVSGTPNVPVTSAPTGLTAAAISGQVTLTWSATAGASSYNVKRSATTGGPYGTIYSGGATTATDSGLVNGTTYYYVVSAINTGGESANSAEVSATPNVATPGAPTNLAAVAGNALANLSWNTVAGATRYSVKRSLTSGGPYTVINSAVIASTYTDTGLTNGTTYYYIVTATNGSGESAASNQASVALPYPSSYTVRWSTKTVGNSIVKYGTSSGALNTTITQDTSPNVTSHVVVITGLAPHTTYYYQAQSVGPGLNTTSAIASFATN